MKTYKIEESDLLKILDALKGNENYHRRRDEMNSQLHMAPEVRHAPLGTATIAARERLEKLMAEQNN